MGKIEIGKKYYDIKLKTSFLITDIEPHMADETGLYFGMEVLESYRFPITKKIAEKGEKVWCNGDNLVSLLKYSLKNL